VRQFEPQDFFLPGVFGVFTTMQSVPDSFPLPVAVLFFPLKTLWSQGLHLPAQASCFFFLFFYGSLFNLFGR